MKKLLIFFAVFFLFQIGTYGQKYEMVIEKTDGTTVVIKTEDIVKVFFREITTGKDDNQGGSYNLTDAEAISILQGKWTVVLTEYDEEEGDETWTEEWDFSENSVKITKPGAYVLNFVYTVKDGVLVLGPEDNREYHKFVSLTPTSFETSDADFFGGKQCIKMVGTKN